MLNWNNIEKAWNEFADLNSTELHYNERNIFHAIECKYNVLYQMEDEKYHFTGILWKSMEGNNRSRTIINIEFAN